MRIHRDFAGLPAAARGASVAIGNFDGVHRGHREVIRTAAGHADAPWDQVYSYERFFLAAPNDPRALATNG